MITLTLLTIINFLVNDDWYYGMCGVEVGIFPTSFVKDK